MVPFTRAACVLGLALLFSDLHAGEPLRLVAVGGDATFSDLQNDHGRIVVASAAGRRPLPAGVTWRLEGDLGGAMGKVLFASWYQLDRVSPGQSPLAASRGFTYEAKAHVVSSPQLDFPWFAATEDGILVVAWVVDEKPLHVAAVPAPDVVSEEWSTRVTFLLSSDAAQRGFPVWLLFRNGALVAPRQFREEAMRWLHAMHFPSGATAAPEFKRSWSAWRGFQGTSLFDLVATNGLEPAVAAMIATLGKGTRSAARETRALQSAAIKGHAAVVRRLIEAGADPNADDRITMLHRTLLRRHDETAAALIEAGARFDVRREGITPAELAIDDPQPRTMAALAAKGGLKPLQRRLDERLAEAVKARRREAVSLLLEHGANPNRRDAQGRTALHHAVAHFDVELVKAVLARGVEVNAADKDGETPLAGVLSRQSRSILPLLVSAGARIDLRSRTAAAQIENAILLDERELLVRAVQDGWSPRANENEVRLLPLSLAKFAGATQVAAWLRQEFSLAEPPPLATVPEGGTPPVRLATPSPIDPRVESGVFPAHAVDVRAVVLADGSLAQVMAATPHDRLRAAVLDAVRRWRFKPAQHAGAPLAIPVSFVVDFPACDNRIYGADELDQPPVLKRAGSFTQFAADHFDHSRMLFTGHYAIGFVVEKDGRASQFVLPVGQPAELLQILEQTAADYRFTPGQRRGQVVRTWIEIAVGSNFTPPEPGAAFFSPR